MNSVANIPDTDTLPRNTITNTHSTRLRKELVRQSTVFLTLLQNCEESRGKKRSGMCGEERKGREE